MTTNNQKQCLLLTSFGSLQVNEGSDCLASIGRRKNWWGLEEAHKLLRLKHPFLPVDTEALSIAD